MAVNFATMETDSGGSTSKETQETPVEETPEQESVTIDYTECGLTENDFELIVPTKLNELLYDVSDHYSAAFQDLTDGIIQIKTIASDLDNNDVWNTPIAKELLQVYDVPDLYNSFQECSNNISLIDYIQENSKRIYDNYLDYTDFALELETVVALVENEMKNNMSEEEFNQIMEEIKNNDNINSIKAFLTGERIGGYAAAVLGRVAAKYGMKLANPGMIAIATMVQNKSYSDLLSISFHWNVLKEGFHAFLTGDKINPGILKVGSTEATGPKGVLSKISGSKLMGGVMAAAIVFGIGFVSDAIHGEITWENELVNLSRAGVAAASSIAGTAVTEALASTAIGAEFGGAIGAGVAIVISIVGNLIIDRIQYAIHYAPNGVPRKYDEINVDTIKDDLNSAGYVLGPPRAPGFENESVYDTFTTLVPNSGNEKLVYYFVQRYNGIEFLSEEEYKKYDVIIRFWQSFPEVADPRGKETLIKTVKEYGIEHGSEDELAFVDALYNAFTKENFDRDERIFNFYWELQKKDR